MTLDEMASDTIQVSLSCASTQCQSFERDETADVSRHFDLYCGDCGALLRQGETITQIGVSS